MRLRVAAYAVIVDDGKILLPHLRRSSQWTLPGGGIEPGEDPADAAVREVKEESGYDVELDRLLGIDNIIVSRRQRVDAWDENDPGMMHGLRIVYRAHVVGGALRAEPEGSSDDAAWHRIEDVATLDRVELVDAALVMAGLTVPRLDPQST